MPEKTDVVTIHTVHSGLKGYKSNYYMNPTLGTINHYRVPNNCNQCEIINDFGLSASLPSIGKKSGDDKT